MRLRPLACLVTMLLILGVPSAHAAPSRRLAAHVPASARVRPGAVLALIDADSPLAPAAGGRLGGAHADLAAIVARHGLTVRVLASARSGGGLRALRFESAEPGFDPRVAARELTATGAFRAVSPNLLLDPFVIPDDPDLPLQWAISNDGGPDVRLPEAWDIGKGDVGTVIAVMDNGVDIGHPDLTTQLWTNTGEIPGNGVDDDGDGWIDDVHGYDFGDGDGDPSSHAFFDPSGIDEGFHGTFVATVAAAANDNGEGIAGAAWRCRLMSLKVADTTTGGITLEAVTAAFAFLDAHPAAVLNMSFGTTDTTARAFFQALVDDAEAHGVLCVAAAGNDGTDTLSFPAGCDHVLSVGSIDATGARSSFSQYGAWVNLSAPGEGIFAGICRNYTIDDLNQLFYILFFGWDGVTPYMYGDGTSFASPLVSGIAGLVRAKYPFLTPAQVRQRLIATADPVVYDQPLGPRVDAYRALTDPLLAVGDATPRIGGAAILSVWPQPARASVTLDFALPEPGHARLALYDAGGRMVRVLADGTYAAGAQRASWDGADVAGRPAPAGIYFARLVTARGADTRRLVRIR
ncbi:MAG: S8 family peptidase [Candidatus Eisenbacteria bacterium]